jgi:4-hydroxy-2-oxoheptanedioate aldolase
MALTGEQFKADLKAGKPKFGLFVNSASPVVATQLSHLGYDWILIDFQHGPMDFVTLGAMINGVHNGKAKVMVRVGSYSDRPGIQQALDLGADGILIPYINTRQEVEEGVSACLYPTKGTRSVYFPGACTNAEGLLGYVPNANKHIIVAIQVETASCIRNIDAIMSVPGVDLAFLGQNDLCMSMGLYEKYVFPEMYSSPELNEATQKMIDACNKNKVILGLFLFGTDRVAEFLKKGFTFIAIGNDLHHILVQAGTFVKAIENSSVEANKPWKRQPSAMLGK